MVEIQFYEDKDFQARSQSLDAEEKKLQVQLAAVRRKKEEHRRAFEEAQYRAKLQQEEKEKIRSRQEQILRTLVETELVYMRDVVANDPAFPLNKIANGDASPAECQLLQDLVVNTFKDLIGKDDWFLQKVASRLAEEVSKLHGEEDARTQNPQEVSDEGNSTIRDQVEQGINPQQPSTAVHHNDSSLLSQILSACQEDTTQTADAMDLDTVTASTAKTPKATPNSHKPVGDHNKTPRKIKFEDEEDTIAVVPPFPKRRKENATGSQETTEPMKLHYNINLPPKKIVATPKASTNAITRSASAANVSQVETPALQERAHDDSDAPNSASTPVTPATPGERPQNTGTPQKLAPIVQSFINRLDTTRMGNLDNSGEFECQKCHKSPAEPRISRCCHLYCAKCLSKLRKKALKKDETARCIKCGGEVGAKCIVVSAEDLDAWKNEYMSGAANADGVDTNTNTNDENNGN